MKSWDHRLGKDRASTPAAARCRRSCRVSRRVTGARLRLAVCRQNEGQGKQALKNTHRLRHSATDAEYSQTRRVADDSGTPFLLDVGVPCREFLDRPSNRAPARRGILCGGRHGGWGCILRWSVRVRGTIENQPVDVRRKTVTAEEQAKA
ncbi:hypothetical protein C8F01DRAFT_190805 [Mycena amicta]|nr:hypothetical protein C8F01DRAFT_190805 [Mycena amicta]